MLRNLTNVPRIGIFSKLNHSVRYRNGVANSKFLVAYNFVSQKYFPPLTIKMYTHIADTDFSTVINAIPFETQKRMTKSEIQKTFRHLFKTRDYDRTYWPEVAEHPHFKYLCSELTSAAFRYNLHENIEMLKILSNFQPVCTDTLHAVTREIFASMTYLPINDLTFLDFILNKFNADPYAAHQQFQTLKLAIPMLFQIHLSTSDTYLPSHLRFIARNSNSISKRITETVIDGLNKRRDKLTAHEASEIIITYCNTGPVTETSKSLIRGAFKVLCDCNLDKFGYHGRRLVMKNMLQAIGNYPCLYDESFIEKTAELLVKSKAGWHKVLSLLKILNKMVSIR